MRYVVTIIAILVVIGGLVALKGAQIGKLIAFGKQMEEAGPPPEAVASGIVEEQSWEGVLTSTGSVATAKGVSLSTDVAGVVTRIAFESGQTVKQGQVLVELDSAVERAQLASAISRRELATTTAKRTRALVASGAISAAQADADESGLRTATTDAEAIQAQIAKKTIRAPFGGKLGIRAVNVGQYLNPGTAVTVLETTEAVHVDFTLPQQRLPDVAVGMPIRISLGDEQDAKDGKDAKDAGAAKAQTLVGKVAAVDPTVDNATRTIRLRADIETGSELLRPGMFVNVTVVLPQENKHTTVPATAVIHAPYGDSVFVIEDPKAEPGKPAKQGKIARQQFVRVGASRGDFVAILDGVKAKQEIVTAGAFKLRNNSPVTVDNSKPQDPKLDPHPENR